MDNNRRRIYIENRLQSPYDRHIRAEEKRAIEHIRTEKDARARQEKEAIERQKDRDFTFKYARQSFRRYSHAFIGVWPLIFIISLIFMLSNNFEIVEKTVTVGSLTYTYKQPSYSSMLGIGTSIWSFIESVLTSLASVGNSLKSLLVSDNGTFNSSILNILSGLIGTVSNIFEKIADWITGIFNN